MKEIIMPATTSDMRNYDRHMPFLGSSNQINLKNADNYYATTTSDMIKVCNFLAQVIRLI